MPGFNGSFYDPVSEEAQVQIHSASTGYGHTGGFAGKPLSNSYVWEAGEGIRYTQADADAGLFKVFSLDRDVHLAVDTPYWSDPTPLPHTDVGLFGGANLPPNVTSFFDFSFDYDTAYAGNPSGSANFVGSTGRIKLNELIPGDQLRVRFDFNVIPQIANTTIEPALWYSNRNANDDVTFSFPLTAAPIFFGTQTPGTTILNRIEISAWITSTEDVNALTLPAIKSNNPVIIQPLGILVTALR